MGFGLDRQIHASRLWKFPVLFHIEDGFSTATRNALMHAMADWGNGLDRGPLFQPVAMPAAGVVTVRKTTGSNAWSSGDSLLGHNSTNGPKSNILNLKEGAGYDTLIHEVGHLLGLAHEHDRMDTAGNDYRKTLTILYKDMVAEQANKTKKYINYGSFDQDSIMCYGTLNTTGPSLGDRATLKAIYGW